MSSKAEALLQGGNKGSVDSEYYASRICQSIEHKHSTLFSNRAPGPANKVYAANPLFVS